LAGRALDAVRVSARSAHGRADGPAHVSSWSASPLELGSRARRLVTSGLT